MKKDFEIPYKDTTFRVYYSSPNDTDRHPGILLIHEVWGLTDHIRDVADRLSNEGYVVMAPDLISTTGITEKINQTIMEDLHDPVKRAAAQIKLREALAPIHSPEFAKATIHKLKDIVTNLYDDEYTTDKIAVVGFCFGGTYAYSLATLDNRLSAIVPFYGHSPSSLKTIENITCPVLAFYGRKDENLMKDLPELKDAMDKYEKNFVYNIYDQAGHAFFNDTNSVTYNKDAADDSWATMLSFLQTNLL